MKYPFATTNKSKIAQFQFCVDHSHFSSGRVFSIYDQYVNVKPYAEDFETQIEIVRHGLYSLFRQINQPVIVEDSILVVKALDGRPGLTANDYLKDNGREGLIEELSGISERSAYVVSLLGYYDGEKEVIFRNQVNGAISEEERYLPGQPDWVSPETHPFGGGYNAVFLLPSLNKTLAELTVEEGLEYGYREPNFTSLIEYLSETRV